MTSKERTIAKAHELGATVIEVTETSVTILTANKKMKNTFYFLPNGEDDWSKEIRHEFL